MDSDNKSSARTMDTARTCERCGKPVSNFAPAGLCRNCLLESGLDEPASPALPGATPAEPQVGRAVPSPPSSPSGQRRDEDIAPYQHPEEQSPTADLRTG